MPRARILVVEDARDIRDLLADRLRDYDLTFATCQVEAYERLKSPVFDLVLLDLRLPRRRDDMIQSNKVGIDILAKIRAKRIVKAGSQMPLPVIVMTAHGSERVSVEVLTDNGANDYIPKPFGTGRELEEKIERALVGGGALVPVGSTAAAIIRVAFHAENPSVRIERLLYHGAHLNLLRVLRDLFVADHHAFRTPERYSGILGDELGDKLGITGQAARQRVVKFRQDVKRDFKEKLERVIDDNDIVENIRDWKGYRLNPVTVKIVAWDEMIEGDE